MVPPVAIMVSAFHQPIRGSEKGIGNLVFVTLPQEVQLRSTFQRSRGRCRVTGTGDGDTTWSCH